MKIDVISYADLIDDKNSKVKGNLISGLERKGIVGVKGVPDFERKSQDYINAARAFSTLPESIKKQYTPARDKGRTEGYELGAERFKNQNGEWQNDMNKASYYAFVPDRSENKWPQEVDLKTPYLALGELIFTIGKKILDKINLNSEIGLNHEEMVGYGRLLHYLQNKDENKNTEWCGGHLDHGVFTGLMPAYYFHDGKPVPEPQEAGLYIIPSDSQQYEKFAAADKSILLFQVGEFGQLISNDKIKATRHKVLKAKENIERYAFALFLSAGDNTRIKSTSVLNKDERYTQNQDADGSITYDAWQISSYARYRA